MRVVSRMDEDREAGDLTHEAGAFQSCSCVVLCVIVLRVNLVASLFLVGLF